MRIENLSCLRLLITIPVIFLADSAVADCNWVQNGHQALCSMHFPNSKKEQTTGSLAVSYEKRYGCNPVFSLIVMNGTSLGAPKKQQRFSTPQQQLAIIINGQVFTDTTNATLYTNAMEYAIYASPSLIHALSISPAVIVKPGGLATFDFANDNKFSQANSKALAFCK